MNRSEILDTAKKYVTQDRNKQHGEPEDNFNNVAGHWNWWLGDRLAEPITAYDVAQMMVGFKQARCKANKFDVDSAVDECGYSALAGEIAVGATDEGAANIAEITWAEGLIRRVEVGTSIVPAQDIARAHAILARASETSTNHNQKEGG